MVLWIELLFPVNKLMNGNYSPLHHRPLMSNHINVKLYNFVCIMQLQVAGVIFVQLPQFDWISSYKCAQYVRYFQNMYECLIYGLCITRFVYWYRTDYWLKLLVNVRLIIARHLLQPATWTCKLICGTYINYRVCIH